MYINFEDRPALQNIGTPCIVIAPIEMKDFRIGCNISTRMISFFLGTDKNFYDFDNWVVGTTIPVLKIIEREDDLFHKLTNYEKWTVK